jgi:monoamine oxidase
MHQNEVIIVGAGLAGLYAAMTLTKKGIPYLLLEANEYIGGRILGSPVTTLENEHYDLGPTWIFPHHQRIQKLIQTLNLKMFQQYIHGDALFQRSGSASTERFSGAGAMELFRIERGTYALIDALSKRIDKNSLHTSHTVNSIKLQDGVWHLEVKAREYLKSFTAKHIVLALPPRMIATHLTIEHWASPSLIHAMKTCQTWMSGQAKFLASYEQPFWRERGLSGQAFSQVGPMIEMHDASIEEDSNYALFGFIGWPLSKRKQFSADSLKQHCIEQLAWFYGDIARDFEQCIIKDWALDDKVASPFDINETSQHPNFQHQRFTDELDNLNLYLAGSEFAQADPGYLEGAIDAVDLSLNKLLLQL